MDSKEMGLVIFQKLFKTKNLHYGFWEKNNKELSIANFLIAQEKYSEFLAKQIEKCLAFNKKAKILDIGCGVGENIRQLSAKGYYVDGIVPSQWMAEQCSKKTKSSIYKCNFEDFADLGTKTKYDLALFSESFQICRYRKII